MKNTTLAIFVLLFISASCKKDPAIPDELLQDITVESTQQQVWLSTHTPNVNDHGFFVTITDAESHSPTHSLSISSNRLSADSLAAVGQLYNSIIPVGEDLTFRVWIKGVNLAGTGIALMINCDDGSENILQVSSSQTTTSIKGTFDWTEYSVDLADVKSEVKNILVWMVFLKNTTGKVYFDDVSLTHRK